MDGLSTSVCLYKRGKGLFYWSEERSPGTFISGVLFGGNVVFNIYLFPFCRYKGVWNVVLFVYFPQTVVFLT